MDRDRFSRFDGFWILFLYSYYQLAISSYSKTCTPLTSNDSVWVGKQLTPTDNFLVSTNKINLPLANTVLYVVVPNLSVITILKSHA